MTFHPFFVTCFSLSFSGYTTSPSLDSYLVSSVASKGGMLKQLQSLVGVRCIFFLHRMSTMGVNVHAEHMTTCRQVLLFVALKSKLVCLKWIHFKRGRFRKINSVLVRTYLSRHYYKYQLKMPNVLVTECCVISLRPSPSRTNWIVQIEWHKCARCNFYFKWKIPKYRP